VTSQPEKQLKLSLLIWWLRLPLAYCRAANPIANLLSYALKESEGKKQGLSSWGSKPIHPVESLGVAEKGVGVDKGWGLSNTSGHPVIIPSVLRHHIGLNTQ
jgi:hypothetical protein